MVLGRIFHPIRQTFTMQIQLTQLSRTGPVYTKEHSLPSHKPQWREKGVCSSTPSSAPPLPLSHKTLAEWRTLIQVSYHEAICCQSSEILSIFICHCFLSYSCFIWVYSLLNFWQDVGRGKLSEVFDLPYINRCP